MGESVIVHFGEGLRRLVLLPQIPSMAHVGSMRLAQTAGTAVLFAGVMFITPIFAGAQQAAMPKASEAASAGLRDAAWNTLTDAVASDKTRSRSDAVSALSIMGSDPRAVKIVERELEDKDEGIRALAAVSLGDMRAERAIPALRQAMGEPSRW